MMHIPIAVGLHSIHEACEADLPGALAAVAEMGYEGVEFAGYYGYGVAELCRLLDHVGLRAVGTHTWYEYGPLVGPGAEEHVAAAVADSHVLGSELLIGLGKVSFPREDRARREGWIEQAGMYNGLARRLAPEGLRVAYHNHAFEFETVIGGETAWEILVAHLSPEVVLELDTGGAYAGGADVLATLEGCAGRAKAVHLKPHSRAEGTRPLIGEDDLPWEEILELCRTVAGTEWAIVEYESDGYPRMEAVRRCLEALREMGGCERI
jgi:sugar phosphate isomerase/epimerase